MVRHETDVSVRDVRGKSRSCDFRPVRYGREGPETEENEEEAGGDCYLGGAGYVDKDGIILLELLGVSSHQLAWSRFNRPSPINKPIDFQSVHTCMQNCSTK